MIGDCEGASNTLNTRYRAAGQKHSGKLGAPAHFYITLDAFSAPALSSELWEMTTSASAPPPLPTPLFLKQCLLDVYLHGNPNTKEGKGKWKEGLLCKSWPAVEHNERVKQITHEMASEFNAVCCFHMKCLDSVLNCCWTVFCNKLCLIYCPCWSLAGWNIHI